MQVSETFRKNLPLCVLDDESDQIEWMTSRLARAGFPAVGTEDTNEALQMVRQGACHAVIADNQMPGMDGWKFLENALHSDPGICVILANGCYSVESAIEAIKRGAYDYHCKPIDFARLLKTLDDLAQVFTQRDHIRSLDEQILSSLEFHGIIGKSPAMLEMFDLARKVARHYKNVLIAGQTGSGKELVAQALQKMSPWRTSGSPCAIVRRSWIRCWKASYSATSATHSWVPRTHGRDYSNTQTAERCFSTKSGRHRWPCRQSCSE